MQKINLYFKIINYVPFFIILFFFLILLIGWLILWPKLGEYNDLKEQIEIKEIELQYKEEYIAELQMIKEKLDTEKDQVQKILSALPAGISTPSIYKFMEEASSGSGMILDTISTFSEGNSQFNNRIKETTFSMNLTGSYMAFKSFLSTLEKSSRIFEMGSISLTNTENQNIFKFQLSIRTFNY